MSNINRFGGLKREFHHIKVMKEGQDAYEPAMVILKEEMKGKSFIIPLYALWKYLDPEMNKDVYPEDRKEFVLMVDKVMFMKSVAVTPRDLDQANQDLACCIVAEIFAKGMGFLLTLSWNLAKMMQMFEIKPSPQVAAQLLLWIQDGLDTLKNMPPCPEDEIVGNAGEVSLFADGQKLGTGPLQLTESDLAERVVH